MGLAIDNQVRYLYVADSSNSAIRRIDVGRPGYVVSTITNKIDTPRGVVIDYSNQNLYISSYNSNNVYKLSLSTNVPVVYAGTGGITNGYLDGYRLNAHFSNPTGLSIDRFDNIYVADQYSIVERNGDEVDYHSIRLIRKSTGNVTTMAGRNGKIAMKCN